MSKESKAHTMKVFEDRREVKITSVGEGRILVEVGTRPHDDLYPKTLCPYNLNVFLKHTVVRLLDLLQNYRNILVTSRQPPSCEC